jgi:hypothetical protein
MHILSIISFSLIVAFTAAIPESCRQAADEMCEKIEKQSWEMLHDDGGAAASLLAHASYVVKTSPLVSDVTTHATIDQSTRDLNAKALAAEILEENIFCAEDSQANIMLARRRTKKDTGRRTRIASVRKHQEASKANIMHPRSPNRTRRGDIAKAKLSIIAVVQTCPTCSANTIIPSYDSFFQGVVSLFWTERRSSDNLQLVHNLTSGRWEFWCGALSEHDQLPYRMAYVTLCMPKLLTQLSTNFPDSTGMFTFHADFWIQPAVVFGIQGTWSGATDKIWHLGRGLVSPEAGDPLHPKAHILTPYPYCFASQKEQEADARANGSHWFWWSQCPYQQLEVLAQAYGEGPDGRTQCCAGWAEAWYLPSDTWQDFRSVATHFAVNDTFTLTMHEVMVHTLLEFLSHNLGHPLRVMTECWGCCCCDLGDDYDKLKRYHCGHSVNLTEDSAITAMTDMLDEQALKM